MVAFIWGIVYQVFFYQRSTEQGQSSSETVVTTACSISSGPTSEAGLEVNATESLLFGGNLLSKDNSLKADLLAEVFALINAQVTIEEQIKQGANASAELARVQASLKNCLFKGQDIGLALPENLTLPENNKQ